VVEIRFIKSVFGILATAQTLSHTAFECVLTKNFDKLVPAAFIRVCFNYDYHEFIHTHCQFVNKLKKAKVIRPYVPLFGSSCVSAFLHTFSHKKSVKRNSGLYKLGHGERSVIWYWEFDVEKRYFRQFNTIDFAIENEQYGIMRSSTANQSLLHLTFQNSPVCHFIFKDTRDMSIYLIQMTAGQSDNNSHKSEHETATTLPE